MARCVEIEVKVYKDKEDDKGEMTIFRFATDHTERDIVRGIRKAIHPHADGVFSRYSSLSAYGPSDTKSWVENA